MVRLIVFLGLFIFPLIVNSQIDTLSISKKLESFNSSEDHQLFWKFISEQDQKYRGISTVDSIDLLNLVKSCMYFNKYGYPDKKVAGNKSSIISIVWIHNSMPQVDKLSFPIIFQGYLEGNISDEALRTYYLRSMYSRSFDDKGNEEKSLKLLIEQLNLKIGKRVNVSELLLAYQKDQEFLNADHKEVGFWITPNTYDTLYLDGKPILNEIENDPIRIFKDDLGNYYLHKLYSDGSFYPRQVFRSNNEFRYFKDSESSFASIVNGDLLFVDRWGQNKKYILQKE